MTAPARVATASGSTWHYAGPVDGRTACGREEFPGAVLLDDAPLCGKCSKWLVTRRPAEWARDQRPVLVGREEARLFTPPLRPLRRSTTRGYDVIDFADQVLGEPLLPWQQWFVIHALELNPDWTYRFKIVLLLVARQNGKTHVKKVINLWKLFLDDVALILGVGQDVSLAREVWSECMESIHAVPSLASKFDKVSRKTGDEWFRLVGGARYKISAANRKAGRGLSVDALDFEELREQRDWAAWSALSKTTMARQMAQIIAASNAGDDQAVVLNHLREAALSGRDPSIGIFEWSGPEDCDLDDPEAWAAANPGLGHTVDESAIRSALNSDPPAVFRTEVLCQRVEKLDSAIEKAAWISCADPGGNLRSKRDRLAVCVEVAKDGKHATAVAAALMADGRVRVEVVGAWPSADEAAAALPALLKALKPVAYAWLPGGPTAAIGAELRDTDDENRVEGAEAMPLSGGKVTEACMGLARLVASRRLLHPDDPFLNAQALGVGKKHTGDGWRFERDGGSTDGIYAAAGAVYAAQTAEVTPTLPKPMVV